jgi:hypothetical protein
MMRQKIVSLARFAPVKRRARIDTTAEHVYWGGGSADVEAVELHEAVKRALG